MDQQPTEEDFDLSIFSFYEWRKLGEQLQVSEEALHDIGYRLQTFQKKKATKATLMAWVQQKGPAATRQALIDALVATNKAEFIHAAALYRAHCRTYAHRVGTGPQHPAEDEDEEDAQAAEDQAAAESKDGKGKKKGKDKAKKGKDKAKKKKKKKGGSGDDDMEELVVDSDSDESDEGKTSASKKTSASEGGDIRGETEMSGVAEGKDGSGGKKGLKMGEVHCLELCRGMLRVILVIVNVVVAVLGLSVMVVGIWASVGNNAYFEIVANNHQITQIPVLLIVVGTFVLLLGIVGVVGAVCAGTLGGRIILGLYGFVLALVVICELVGGIVAGVMKGQLSTSFEESAQTSFQEYLNDTSVADAWNSAQEELKCCGNVNYTDYAAIFKNESVPQSCCNDSALTGVAGGPNCESAAKNVTLYYMYIYSEGCTAKVESIISHNLSVIAGVTIFFGLLQIVGVVISCFVAIARRQGGGYEHV